MPEAVLNTAPEHKQKKHISQDVQPSPVQEHGDKNGSHREPEGERVDRGRGVAGRNEPVNPYKVVQVRAQTKLIKKGPKVQNDQKQGDGPEGAAPNVVGQGNRNHVVSFYRGDGVVATENATAAR